MKLIKRFTRLVEKVDRFFEKGFRFSLPKYLLSVSYANRKAKLLPTWKFSRRGTLHPGLTCCLIRAPTTLRVMCLMPLRTIQTMQTATMAMEI
jgi:hypothetical protein